MTMLPPPVANLCMDEAAMIVSFLPPISLHQVISTNHELKKRFDYKKSLEILRQQPDPLAKQILTAIKTARHRDGIPLDEADKKNLSALLRVAVRQDDPPLTPIKEFTLSGSVLNRDGFGFTGNVCKWVTHFQFIERLEIIEKKPQSLVVYLLQCMPRLKTLVLRSESALIKQYIEVDNERVKPNLDHVEIVNLKNACITTFVYSDYATNNYQLRSCFVRKFGKLLKTSYGDPTSHRLILDVLSRIDRFEWGSQTWLLLGLWMHLPIFQAVVQKVHSNLTFHGPGGKPLMSNQTFKTLLQTNQGIDIVLRLANHKLLSGVYHVNVRTKFQLSATLLRAGVSPCYAHYMQRETMTRAPDPNKTDITVPFLRGAADRLTLRVIDHRSTVKSLSRTQLSTHVVSFLRRVFEQSEYRSYDCLIAKSMQVFEEQWKTVCRFVYAAQDTVVMQGLLKLSPKHRGFVKRLAERKQNTSRDFRSWLTQQGLRSNHVTPTEPQLGEKRTRTELEQTDTKYAKLE